MKIDPTFSEFNFGFSYTFERVLQDSCNQTFGGPPRLPLIPNQVIERWLGFDVMFRSKRVAPLCLQYKMPELMSAAQRRNHDKKHTGFTFTGPCYRFNITPHQHDRLAKFVSANPFYCVPKFVSLSDLEQHFQQSTITKHSRLFRAKPLSSQMTHQVYFDTNGKQCIHSEPQELEDAYDYAEIREILRGGAIDPRELLPILSRQLANIDIPPTFIESLERTRELELPESLFISYFWIYAILRVCFNADLHFVTYD